MAERYTLDPKLDIVFWMLFGAERNRELLLSLLNAVLQPSSPISVVEVLPSEPERVGVHDKNIALDIRCRFGSGEQVDVEMQSQKRPAQSERMLYYWARLYAGQLARGMAYSELRRSVVVMIADFCELAQDRMHSCFAIRERRSGSVLSDHLELHFVELPKLKQALATNDEPSLVQWAKFLSAKSDGDLEQLAMESPILKRAKDALDALSADDIARMRAEQRETALRMAEFELGAAYSQGVAQGKAEGVAQGKAEGVAQGKAQLFTRLLCLKFGSLTESVEQRIAAATADDIDHWTQQLLQAKTLEDVFASR